MPGKLLLRLKIWGPVVLWASVIFLFSSFPVAPASKFYWQDFIVKKSAHLLEYCILAALLYRALRIEEMEKSRAWLLSVLVTIIYAVTDEFHQSFTPGREPRIRDVAFDTIGGVVGATLCKKYL